jgi:hypothetical protein
VLLVLEGGIQTLKTTAEAIAKETPVVVIKDSGRAADFIAYAFYKHKYAERSLLAKFNPAIKNFRLFTAVNWA